MYIYIVTIQEPNGPTIDRTYSDADAAFDRLDELSVRKPLTPVTVKRYRVQPPPLSTGERLVEAMKCRDMH